MANAYAFCCNNERQTPQMFKFKNFQTIKLYPIHKTASDANFVCVCVQSILEDKKHLVQ